MSNVSCKSNVSDIASLPDIESNPRRPAQWRDNSICSDSSEAEEIAAEAMAGAGISLEEWPIPTHSSHRLSPEPDADIEVGLADVSVVDEVSLRAHESVNKQWRRPSWEPVLVEGLALQSFQNGIRQRGSVIQKSSTPSPLKEKSLTRLVESSLFLRFQTKEEATVELIQEAFVYGDGWFISRRNALEGVVERHPLLSMQGAQGYRLLAFWRRPADVDAYEGL